MKLYCPTHRRNENLTDTQAEALIHGLWAGWTDEQQDDARERGYRDGVYDLCPISRLRSLSDPEVYYEHIEAMRDCRIATAREERAA